MRPPPAVFGFQRGGGALALILCFLHRRGGILSFVQALRPPFHRPLRLSHAAAAFSSAAVSSSPPSFFSLSALRRRGGKGGREGGSTSARRAFASSSSSSSSSSASSSSSSVSSASSPSSSSSASSKGIILAGAATVLAASTSSDMRQQGEVSASAAGTREGHPTATIIAGNVVTGEMVEELILSGADIVKVGIGPGSVCTTRKQTGVGYPQLSAIMECADAAHGLNGLVVGDGGCTCPGDVAKAFGAGADFVMLGGMLAGHDEAAGEMVEQDGKFFKQFYGMSSGTAMHKHSGGVAEYRSSEGKTVMVPYRGPVAATVQDILGGLRSTCTYVGAGKLKELSKRTTFIRVTQQLNPVFGPDQKLPPLPTSRT
ncbi:hypothetical protein VYU27_004126 [Nannochloropsis oceanica]